MLELTELVLICPQNRHIYTNEITITSVANALELFSAANQFLLDDLCRICLTFLYDNCNEDNVLEMLSHFSTFSYLRPSYLTPVDLNGSPVSLSALMSRQSSLQFSNNCDNILNELITRCYYTLDSSASRILASDAFSNLEHDLIVKILSRDTLNIVSEMEVFESIKRWACHQCKRQCLELTGDNKRQVLGKALYCPRYLAITFDEFMRGPQMSDLLTDEEKRPLLARLAGDSQVPPLPDQLRARKQDVRRRFVEQVPKPIANEMVANNSSAGINGSNAGIIAKKKSTSKKLLNGLGDMVIFVIRLLDWFKIMDNQSVDPFEGIAERFSHFDHNFMYKQIDKSFIDIINCFFIFSNKPFLSILMKRFLATDYNHC